MPRYLHRSEYPVSSQALYDWHMRPGALERLTPPWEQMEVLQRDPSLDDGARMVARLKTGPIPMTWVATHRDHIPGQQFVDVQTQGPFKSWVHTHRFLPLTPSTSALEDDITYQLPLGPLGALGDSYAQQRLQRGFAFRHARLARDLALHQEYAHLPRLTVAISGASGLLGTAITHLLTTGGHKVLPLVRRSPKQGEIQWDPARARLDPRDLEGVDAVLHLAGENVGGGRWTQERKAAILDSRTQGTRLLAQTVAKLPNPPKVFVSASAVGYYGHQERPVSEQAPHGQGFLSEVCQAWEASTAPLHDHPHTRLVIARIGVVLTPQGGALKEMLPPFLAGAGGPLGDGQQGMPWISIDDVLQMLYRALMDPRLHGPVNLTSPNPTSQREFASQLAKALHRPSFLPTPAAAIRALFGEMGQRVLLEGAFVIPKRLQELAFPFYHPTLADAFREMFPD
jgi:uncharacterized protein (TIGR01777 family)